MKRVVAEQPELVRAVVDFSGVFDNEPDSKRKQLADLPSKELGQLETLTTAAALLYEVFRRMAGGRPRRLSGDEVEAVVNNAVQQFEPIVVQ